MTRKMLLASAAGVVAGGLIFTAVPALAQLAVIDPASIVQQVKSFAQETGILDVLTAMNTIQTTISNTEKEINTAIGGTSYGDTNTLLREGFTQEANYQKGQVGAQQQITDASNTAMARFQRDVRNSQIRDQQTPNVQNCTALDSGQVVSAAAQQGWRTGQTIEAVMDPRGEGLPGTPAYYGAAQAMEAAGQVHLSRYCSPTEAQAGLCTVSNQNMVNADQRATSLFGNDNLTDGTGVNAANDFGTNLIEPVVPAALRGDQLTSVNGQDAAARRREYNARMSLARNAVDMAIGQQTPGLQNDRLQEMMRATSSIDDTRLVRDIRSLATSVGARGGDQNTADIRDRVEVLENRIRIATPVSGPAAAGAPEPRTPGQDERQTRPGPGTAEHPNVDRSQEPQGARRSMPGWEEPSTSAKAADTSQAAQPQVSVSGRGPGVIASALAGLARAARAETPDWERQPTSVVDRSERHENVFQQRRDEATIQGAEKSQRAALDALQGFANGPGSSILTKIQDAAKAEPGGMQAVLSEMREGGRFAGLRQQFNADLVMERGAAAAWDRMAGSLQQYGEDRAAVAAIGARTNTTAALDARFEKMDADIAKAASIIPGKSDGKSVIDDISDKLREVLDRAVTAVKAIFNPSADRNARADPSPAPSP